MPTRGAQVCTFKEISRQLAGFRDPRPVAATVGAGHPDAPPPVDHRDTESLEGSDVALPEEAVGYGVPAGKTERELADASAATTYGDPARADAGAQPAQQRDPKPDTSEQER
jgi:hypothetical protein